MPRRIRLHDDEVEAIQASTSAAERKELAFAVRRRHDCSLMEALEAVQGCAGDYHQKLRMDRLKMAIQAATTLEDLKKVFLDYLEGK